ncbi:Putative ubiquitin carboxyl-terminal hydrolase 50, partial [Frankliniella fusca]
LSGPKGLINLGATCYINGIIQCLMGLKELTFLLANQRKSGPVSSALLDVLLSLDSVGEAEDISEFLCIIAQHWENYRPNTQMDSEEFLTFLLLAIHEEMKTITGNLEVVVGADMIENCINAWTCHNTSTVSSLFSVQIVTLTFCSNCKFSHGQYSDINSHLSVELPLVENTRKKQEMKTPIRLEDCLLSFTKEEEQTDAICSSCKCVGIKHRLIIGRLPPVLVIHLKRFKLYYNGSLKKIVREVFIPERLDLAPYTVELLQSNTSYRLIGMTDHHGTSINNGHYTAVSLRDERWYHFDDTKVSNTTSRKLRSASTTAYLVWYRLNKDLEGDLPLDKIPTTLTDKGAFIAKTPEVETNTSCSYNDTADRHFINSDGESEVDMFAMTDESDTDSDNRIFQLEMPKSCNTTYSEWHPDKAARTLNNLNIKPTPQVPDPSQQEPNHVPPSQLCDHPLYDLDIMDPQLTEDDVPGAKLNIDDIDMYDTGTLKRWLQCRRITTKEVKADLKSRVTFHVLNGKENKIYQGFEGGKWYEE